LFYFNNNHIDGHMGNMRREFSSPSYTPW